MLMFLLILILLSMLLLRHTSRESSLLVGDGREAQLLDKKTPILGIPPSIIATIINFGRSAFNIEKCVSNWTASYSGSFCIEDFYS